MGMYDSKSMRTIILAVIILYSVFQQTEMDILIDSQLLSSSKNLCVFR